MPQKISKERLSHILQSRLWGTLLGIAGGIIFTLALFGVVIGYSQIRGGIGTTERLAATSITGAVLLAGVVWLVVVVRRHS